MKISKILLTGATACCTLSATAQYNPTLDVEGKYKPEFIPQEKVNTFPERMRFGTLKSRLEFDTHGVTTDFTPRAVPIEATGWNDTKTPYPWRGYVDLEMGSWLNARLNAGYRFLNTEETLGGVYLRHNSTSLWKPNINDYTADTRRYLYDETIGAYIRHSFSGTGILDAHLRYNLACFNYYGFSPEINILDMPDAPEQTLNDFSYHLNWTSQLSGKFNYYAGLDGHYMAFRRFYTPLVAESYQGMRETTISPRAGVSYELSNTSVIGLHAMGDAVIYGSQKQGAQSVKPGTYGRLSLTPYYKLDSEHAYLSAGPKIDLIFSNGPTFRIAPEVRLSVFNSKISAEIEATGGTRLNTLEFQREQSLYCAPNIPDLRPLYTPVEAAIKFGCGPFAGFRAQIEGRFRMVNDQLTDGWYTPYLNHNPPVVPQSVPNYYDGKRLDTYGFSVGLTLAYRYGRYIDITANAAYQPQERKKSFFNGWDLPEATAHIAVSSNPWRSLKLGVDWDLRANRKPLLYTAPAPDADPELSNTRMDNWSNLSFRASYDILPNLTMQLDVDNILNRRQEMLSGLPMPGITAMGGLIWQF